MTRRFKTTDQQLGYCVEVVELGERNDRKLVGYAIHFSGWWNGYVRTESGDMRRVCSGAVEKEQAVEAVKDNC